MSNELDTIITQNACSHNPEVVGNALCFPTPVPTPVPGPNGTVCVPPEVFQYLTLQKDAIFAAGACFVAGMIWMLFLIWLYKKYGYLLKKG